MKKPASLYKWTWDWAPERPIWRLTVRATGQIVGRCPHVDMGDGSAAWEGRALIGGEWQNLGQYDHWTKAKRAVLDAVSPKEVRP